MSKRRSSLTGSWSGAYRYPGDAFPETVFNAHIEEADGAFVGNIEEPNLTHPWMAAVNTAEIEGIRIGAAVTFTKFYQKGAYEHAVRYEGQADATLMRIDGAWIIPGVWSGTFFMVRDDDGATAEAEEAAEIELRR